MASLSDLLIALSNFDPECPVEVLHSGTDWVYENPEDGSFPVTVVDWRPFDETAIMQRADGTILIGFAGDM